MTVSKETTKVRQADDRRVSYRVLVKSLAIAVLVGCVLYAGFYYAQASF
jgi:hypothetical protein